MNIIVREKADDLQGFYSFWLLILTKAAMPLEFIEDQHTASVVPITLVDCDIGMVRLGQGKEG